MRSEQQALAIMAEGLVGIAEDIQRRLATLVTVRQIALEHRLQNRHGPLRPTGQELSPCCFCQRNGRHALRLDSYAQLRSGELDCNRRPDVVG